LVIIVFYYNALFLLSGSSSSFQGAVRGGTLQQEQSYNNNDCQQVITWKQPLLVYLPNISDGDSWTIELRHFLKPSSRLNTCCPLALMAQSGNAVFEKSLLIDTDYEEPPKCNLMHPWQTQPFYSCSKLHDLDLTDIEFINCGTSQCAFSILADDGKEVTLKIQKYVPLHFFISFCTFVFRSHLS
jgi:hypothetical protein